MSKNRRRKAAASTDRRRSRQAVSADVGLEPPDGATREKRLQLFILAALLLFGAYQSVLYFGHQVVPNSDFPGFADVARPLLSFKLPGYYKRAPGLGTFHILLGKIVGGQHPELTAGWLLNAILHPLNLVLLYLIGSRLLGRAAVWFAILAIINPWTLSMLVQPLVETSLIFFTLLTLYFIIRRSSWCYLFACMATMIRYEGAGLIFAAFVVDIIQSDTWKQRGMYLLKAAAASVPLGIWVLLTVTSKKDSAGGGGGGDYLGYYGHGTVFGKYISLLWKVTFASLAKLPAEAKAMFVRLTGPEAADALRASVGRLNLLSQIAAAIGLAASLVFGLLKRKREFLALVLFFVPYFLVHTLKSGTRERYCIPVAWLALLLCFYGYKSLWELIRTKRPIPPVVVKVLQVLLIVIAILWASAFGPYLSKTHLYSQHSAKMAYIAMALAAVVVIAHGFAYRARHILTCLTAASLVGLGAVSSQFNLASIMGNGDRDIEFKKLADWYVEEAQPGDRIVTTMPHLLKIFAPAYSADFYFTQRIRGEGPTAFIEDCYKKNITYIAWDSRLGFAPKDSYYRKYGLDRIAMLGRGRDVGAYEFVTRISHSDRRYIEVYRLHKPPNASTGRNRPQQQ